jgi:TRAP-type C4-dicarboxylate transport system substrate-binding protein
MVMGKKAWNSLSPSQQQAVKEAGAWSWEESTKTAYNLRANVDKSRQARVKVGFVDNGELPEADMAELVKAFRHAWKIMAEKSGDKGARIYKSLSSL